MKTLVVVGHPKLASSNTQPFFKEALNNHRDVTWHPLNQNFDINQEQELLKKHDRIILQFPLYWYSAPAILKQWLDNVWTTSLVTGNQYALANKELGLVVTAGDRQSAFQAGGDEQFTVSELMRPFEALAHKARMHYLPILAVHQFLYLTPDDQQRLLVNYQQYVTNPDFKHFDGQAKWFQAELQKRIDKNPEQAPLLETLLDTIANQQDELNDLQWNLTNLKKEDDS